MTYDILSQQQNLGGLVAAALDREETAILFDVLDDAIEVCVTFHEHLEGCVLEGNFDETQLDEIVDTKQRRDRLMSIKSKMLGEVMK
jgi:hypothetical protein